MNKPQNERLLYIKRQLEQKTYVKLSTFKNDLEVSERTLMRDLTFLRERLGYPILYSRHHRAWYLAAEVKNHGNLFLDDKDNKYLFLCKAAANECIDDDMMLNVGLTFKKLSALFGHFDACYWDESHQHLSFVYSIERKLEHEQFTILWRMVSQSRVIQCQIGSSNLVEEIEPYHMANLDGEWCLVFHRPQNPSLFLIPLISITILDLTEKKFQISMEFEIEALRYDLRLRIQDGRIKIKHDSIIDKEITLGNLEGYV